MTPEKTPRNAEQQASLIVAHLRGRQDGWDWAEHIIASAIREAQASARDEERSTVEAYETCLTVARIRLAHIKPEVEAEIPTLCEIEESIWLQHKEHMPICAIDMLAHAEKKIAIRSARDDALEEAARDIKETILAAMGDASTVYVAGLLDAQARVRSLKSKG